MSVKVESAVMIRRPGERIFRPYDVRFSLANKIVSRLQPDPDIFRTMTVGPHMYTEYLQLSDIPLLTFFHECGHLEQWTWMRWPQTPNFLLNYMVLKSAEWERQAQANVRAIWTGEHATIDVAPKIRRIFKQPSEEAIRQLLRAS